LRNIKTCSSPRNDFNAHRLLRDDEDLDLIFTFREPRKVSDSLTLQYDKTIYLLPDTPGMRKLIHRYIEVYEYPDGRIEVRTNGTALPYTTYDRLPEIDQGAIVENKRARTWHTRTRGGFASRSFNGDHFFLHEHREALVIDILSRWSPVG